MNQEQNALSRIEAESNPEALLQIARNARDTFPAVAAAALRRLSQVLAQGDRGTIEHDCWQMVHAVEALRRLNGRKVSRMNRMRPKIGKDGEKKAIEYCALNKTEGFDEVMSYGMPELSAEAIVLRHASEFGDATIVAARRRLVEKLVVTDESGRIVQNLRQLNDQ
jgi:hypothetical protein